MTFTLPVKCLTAPTQYFYFRKVLKFINVNLIQTLNAFSVSNLTNYSHGIYFKGIKNHKLKKKCFILPEPQKLFTALRISFTRGRKRQCALPLRGAELHKTRKIKVVEYYTWLETKTMKAIIQRVTKASVTGMAQTKLLISQLMLLSAGHSL